ncbi:hypothetical protein [Candidatus Borrelia fainii]|nr:hypothetical protein [Candidatus Borrelia fainii]
MKKYIFIFLILIGMLSCESLDKDTEENNYYKDGQNQENKW